MRTQDFHCAMVIVGCGLVRLYIFPFLQVVEYGKLFHFEYYSNINRVFDLKVVSLSHSPEYPLVVWIIDSK